MKLIEALRFDAATLTGLHFTPSEDGLTAVLIITAPITRRNMEILNLAALADGTIPLAQVGPLDDIDAVSLELPAALAGDEVVQFDPEKLAKLTISPVEDAGFAARFRVHFKGQSHQLLDFAERWRKAEFNCVVRPLQGSLFTQADDSDTTGSLEKVTAEDVAGLFAETHVQQTLSGSTDIAYKAEKVVAMIRPVELAGGYAASWSAKAQFRYPRLMPETSTATFASEREAIEVAAAAVRTWARGLFAECRGQDKKHAAGLIQWAEQYMSREQLARSPIPEPEAAEEPEGAVVQ